MARRKPTLPALFTEPAPPAGTLVFVYDRKQFTGAAEGWINHNRERPAFARGKLYRNSKGQLALRPVPGGPEVRGAVVDVAPQALAVLDFVARGGGSLRRERIAVSVNLHMVEAEAWVLGDETGWKVVRAGGR